eukprot:TRINITY_DN89077_c0_g1_i1.p1 TRINITY_DN89077_c0_g1~~TRINITY_DN89077_c0_g1_i1.p1  ORF type:complete len:304 (+),score=41.82 TRINITY_DN89077_c0_g1_i1:54-914(+)
MEPVSILLATGAIAVYAAHRAERMTEKARRGPVTLPEMMDAPTVDEEAPVQLLIVHLRRAQLRRRLLGETLKVRVKYGDPGVSIRCDTREVHVRPPPVSPAAKFVRRLDCPADHPTVPVDFGTTFLFLGHRNSPNCVRLRLMRRSMLARTIAKAELRLPPLVQCRPWEEFSVDLEGQSVDHPVELLGTLELALESRVVPKGQLRLLLSQLGAEKQSEGFLMDLLPAARGEVCEEEVDPDSEDDNPVVVQGEYISAPLPRRAFGLCGLCKGGFGRGPTLPATVAPAN